MCPHVRGSLALLTVLFAAATASGEAVPLRYRFTASDRWVYETSLSTELTEGTETIAGHLVVTVDSVDPANGRAVLSSRLRVNQTITERPRPLGPRIGHDLFRGFPFAVGGSITVDDCGTVVNVRGSGGGAGGAQLPYLLGLATRLPIEPLPDRTGRADWSVEAPVILQDVQGGRYGLPGTLDSMPYDGHDSTDSRTFHVTAPADSGRRVTVHKTYSLVTTEKVGDQPLLRQAGEGQFEFDPAAGRVAMLVEKQTITLRSHNVTIEVPTSLTLTFVDGDAAKRLLAADDAADARAAAQNAQAQAEAMKRAKAGANAAMGQAMAQLGADEDRLERDGDGQRTPLAGGHGGVPFAKSGSGTAPVLGIRYTTAKWMGRRCVRQVDPVFGPDDASGKGKIIMARDGYAVGGLEVGLTGTDVMGFTIIFCQLHGGKLDLTQEYRSDLIAERGADQKTLGHDGRIVVGLCGRQGLNLDAAGLVMAPK